MISFPARKLSHTALSRIETIKRGPKAVMKWKRPKSPTEIHSFLGLIKYYKRFIQDFSSIDAPLITLAHKWATYTWTEKYEDAFEKLKKQLCETPILALPMELKTLQFTVTYLE